jgi:hypothetical protein
MAFAIQRLSTQFVEGPVQSWIETLEMPAVFCRASCQSSDPVMEISEGSTHIPNNVVRRASRNN